MLSIIVLMILPLLAVTMVLIVKFVPVSTLESIVNFIDNQIFTTNKITKAFTIDPAFRSFKRHI
jgi:hypothetical protein